MHGTTMIFLAVMPLDAAFFNLLIPLQIGARDVAFPRLNAFSLWVFLAGAIILNVGWFLRLGRARRRLVRLRAADLEALHARASADFWIDRPRRSWASPRSWRR